MNLPRQVEGEGEEEGTLNVAEVLGASLSARAKPKRQRAASNTPGPVARVRVRARARAGPERPFKNLLSHQARPLLNAVRRRHPDASRKW